MRREAMRLPEPVEKFLAVVGVFLLMVLSALALCDLYFVVTKGRVHATAWRGHRGEWITYRSHTGWFVVSAIFEIVIASVPFVFIWLWLLGRRTDRAFLAKMRTRDMIDGAVRQTAGER